MILGDKLATALIHTGRAVLSISGIYVLIDPQYWESATNSLGDLPGVDLHHSDADSGRLVVTQETDSTQEHFDGLERIQSVVGVRMAGPVYHFVEEEDGR